MSYVIGITGGSGSGKTTFIRALRDRFDEESLCILSQDDYYRPREEQKIDERGIKNFDLPQAIDGNALLNDLKEIMEGNAVARKEYTFNNPKAEAGVLHFKPAPVILVEGIFVFYYEEIKKLCDLKVFLYAKENIKVIRRIRRDREERNYPLEDVLYRYEHHVLPTFEQYIRPYQEEADLIINNNNDFTNGLKVLSAFIEKVKAK